MLLIRFELSLGIFNRISEFELVLHPGGSKVPHPRMIKAILGGAALHAD